MSAPRTTTSRFNEPTPYRGRAGHVHMLELDRFLSSGMGSAAKLADLGRFDRAEEYVAFSETRAIDRALLR